MLGVAHLFPVATPTFIIELFFMKLFMQSVYYSFP